MGLYGGIWYDPSTLPEPTPCELKRGLVVAPEALAELAAAAPGAPIMWDHTAMAAIEGSKPGAERAAAAAHPLRVGTVEAAWVDRNGVARVVWSIFTQYSRVAELVQRRKLGGLSATHVVGTNRFVELSLTSSPARPGCEIEGHVTDVAEYISLHPPW